MVPCRGPAAGDCQLSSPGAELSGPGSGSPFPSRDTTLVCYVDEMLLGPCSALDFSGETSARHREAENSDCGLEAFYLREVPGVPRRGRVGIPS